MSTLNSQSELKIMFFRRATVLPTARNQYAGGTIRRHGAEPGGLCASFGPIEENWRHPQLNR